MWYELTRGLAYLSIRHPSINWYTVRLPVILATALCVIYVLLPVKPRLLGDGGLLGSMLGVIATLPGFYFAALAAIATFDRPGMDNEIPAPAPRIDVIVHGKPEPVDLTRRMFLSYLFSYLTTLSLGLCGLILALNALHPTIIMISTSINGWEHAAQIHSIGRAIIFIAISLPASALAITTLHGIFFLTERLHQPY